MKLSRLLFVIILLFFILKGIFYIFYIPPWESPDSLAHVDYVFYLYHNKKLPDAILVPSLVDSMVSSRNFQKLYLSHTLQTGKTVNSRELFNRFFYAQERKINFIYEHPPLYYLYQLPFLIVSLHFSSYFTYVFLCTGSLILGIVSLILSFKIAKLVFPKSTALAYIVMVLLALDPMYTFMNAVVNSDAMVLVAFYGFLFLILKYVLLSTKSNTKHFVFIGIFTSISTLVKPQLLILIPIYLTTIIIQFGLKVHWKKYLYISMSTFIVPIFWYSWKYFQQGSNSFTYAFVSKHSESVSALQYPLEFIKRKQPVGIFMGFWGFFGWLDVSMPKYIYGLFFLILTSALVGWLLKRKKNSFPKEQKKIWTFFSITCIFYTSFLLLYDILFFAKGGNFGIQGRYFLPLLPIFLIWTMQGIVLFPNKLRTALLLFCISSFILSQILMYTSISTAYYTGYYVIPPLVHVYK